MKKSNEKLNNLIKVSSLNDDDKKQWQDSINGLPEQFCTDILDFLEMSPDGLATLTNSLKEKIGAIKNQDIRAFENILQKDKKYIESLKE